MVQHAHSDIFPSEQRPELSLHHPSSVETKFGLKVGDFVGLSVGLFEGEVDGGVEGGVDGERVGPLVGLCMNERQTGAVARK